jgi:hypothetical protein
VLIPASLTERKDTNKTLSNIFVDFSVVAWGCPWKMSSDLSDSATFKRTSFKRAFIHLRYRFFDAHFPSDVRFISHVATSTSTVDVKETFGQECVSWWMAMQRRP